MLWLGQIGSHVLLLRNCMHNIYKKTRPLLQWVWCQCINTWTVCHCPSRLHRYCCRSRSLCMVGYRCASKWLSGFPTFSQAPASSQMSEPDWRNCACSAAILFDNSIERCSGWGRQCNNARGSRLSVNFFMRPLCSTYVEPSPSTHRN